MQVSLAGGDRLRETLSFFPDFFSVGRVVDAVLKRAGGALLACHETTLGRVSRRDGRHVMQLYGGERENAESSTRGSECTMSVVR